jgi:hypothetical protein
MTLGSRIYLDPGFLGEPGRAGGVLLVHEMIHTRQWREFGFLGFVRRYLGDYIRGRLQGKDHRQAYMDIRFEVEARRLAALIE